MTRLVVESQVGADGVLRLDIPLGAADANLAVKVTIDAVQISSAEKARHVGWLDRIAGGWQGNFEHLPHGDFESRDLDSHFTA